MPTGLRGLLLSSTVSIPLSFGCGSSGPAPATEPNASTLPAAPGAGGALSRDPELPAVAAPTPDTSSEAPPAPIGLAGGGAGAGGEAPPVSGTGGVANAAGYCWRSVSIGGGGFVSGLVFSRLEQGLLFARTDVCGAYRWS